MWPNLPKLRDQAVYVKAIGRAGVWHYEPSSQELARLAESLDLGLETTSQVLEKLPDMFARAIMFHIVLGAGDSDHPLYERVRGAFRGLLALLGLWKRKGLALDADKVSVAARREEVFINTASRLLPHLKLARDTGWQDLFVFVVDQTPVGFASPLTLVCPNAGAQLETSLTGIPWLRAGEFVDPISHLSQLERGLLSRWVRELHGSVARHPDANAEMAQTIGRELGSFADALGVDEPNAAIVEGLGTLGETGGMFRYLGFTLAESTERSDRSMVQLIASHGRGVGRPHVLVIDETLAERWRRAPAEITVYGAVTLADLERRTDLLGTRPDVLGNARLIGAVWRRSDHFLTSKLLLIDEVTDAFPGVLRISGQDQVAARQRGTPLLPVRAELLDYLSPEDLVRNCSYSADDAAVTVQLTLPLAGGNCVVRRTYSGQDIVRVADLPVLEIWPDFLSQHWSVYFALWDRAGSDATFYAKPVGAHGKGEPRREFDQRGNVEREVTELASAPECVVCMYPRDASEPMGILLIDLPVRESGGGECHVGIDFGTTNTHVYLKEPGKDPEALRLLTGCHRVTRSGDAIRAYALYNYFLPLSDADDPHLPFLSLFRSRSAALPTDADHAVVSGHILFIPRGFEDSVAKPNVHAYLKWDKREDAKRRVKSYLRQVALQAAAEVVARGAGQIELSYSYPTAFSTPMRHDMATTWREIAEAIEGSTKLRCAPPRGYSESVTAARYFRKRHGATPLLGATVLDIGGGTTDIAVWQTGRLVWQASVRLAGQELLLQPLYHLRSRMPPGLFRSLFDRDVDLRSDRGVFFREVDALLKTQSRELKSRLHNIADTEPVPYVARHLTIGLAGLLYYTGLMLRTLVETKSYVAGAPRVYVGGNGSRMFDWASRGDFDAEPSPLASLFREVVLKPSGLSAEGLEIRRTTEPKAEAACGLVVEPFADGPGSEDVGGADSVITGEACLVDGEQRGVLTEADFREKRIELGALTNFEAFVRLFNEYARGRNSIVLPIESERDLLLGTRDAVLEHVLQQRGKAEGQVELEPVFVTALKIFLDKLLERLR